MNLTQLIIDNLEPDIKAWKHYVPQMLSVKDMVYLARYWDRFNTSPNVRRLVEIRGNRLRFPLLPEGPRQFDCDHACDPYLAPWAELVTKAAAYQLELPNVLFLLNVKDRTPCFRRLALNGSCRVPSLSTTKPVLTGVDILVPPLRAQDAEVVHRSKPWGSKSDKAFFRGVPSCSGGMLGNRSICARSWVARLAQVNHSDILDAGLVEKHEAKDDPVLRGGHGPLPVLNRKGLDVLPDYKYLLNLDGHTAAYRLAILLATNSLVLKQESRYLEWYYRSLKPYQHYVPIFNYTLHDLVPQLEWAKAHEDAVQAIIKRANRFAMQYTTMHARLVYVKYAMIAYKRLFADMDAWFQRNGSLALLLQ
jgi:protein glucosyltransferase